MRVESQKQDKQYKKIQMLFSEPLISILGLNLSPLAEVFWPINLL